MKINSLKLWRFRCFGALPEAGDSEATPNAQNIDFDTTITTMIGRNGAGKSALLMALTRLFGETRDERAVQGDDFYVKPGETLESALQRQFYIEVEIGFPELDNGDKEAEKTVPSVFRNMFIDGPDGKLIARVRLEATWQSTGSLDGDIEENVYWILTNDPVGFGEVPDPLMKRKMSGSDRSQIVVRYIPAARDITALTKLTVRSLGRSLMQSVKWQNEEAIKKLIAQAGEALSGEDALKRVNDVINQCWVELNAADTATRAALHVLPPDFQQVVGAASIVLSPSGIGRTMSIEHLSDGQRSLFHFALVKALLDLKLALEKEAGKEPVPPFSAAFMQAPALTIFAFEEPENHLAPYFLSKLITELQTLSVTQRVQGIITSHSPAIVGRLEPELLRYVRRDAKSGISTVAKLTLPDPADEALKFVREAVRAHPEIYFARHAIFGEGASEEIVLPKLAEALDFPIDRSFVAIVPIGGRYVGHFWRLVTQLGISYTTLLDLDLGRSSGDVRQFKAVASAIKEFRTPPADSLKNLDTAIAMTREKDNPQWNWTRKDFETWLPFFEREDVFFSAPLDLDMLMLQAFPAAYQKLEDKAHGPRDSEKPERQGKAAESSLKDGGYGVASYAEYPEMMPLFPWYSYLFLGNRGKPAAHMSALSQLTPAERKVGMPPVLRRLLDRVRAQLEAQVA